MLVPSHWILLFERECGRRCKEGIHDNKSRRRIPHGWLTHALRHLWITGLRSYFRRSIHRCWWDDSRGVETTACLANAVHRLRWEVCPVPSTCLVARCNGGTNPCISTYPRGYDGKCRSLSGGPHGPICRRIPPWRSGYGRTRANRRMDWRYNRIHGRFHSIRPE